MKDVLYKTEESTVRAGKPDPRRGAAGGLA
jgi:hypothetical protein